MSKGQTEGASDRKRCRAVRSRPRCWQQLIPNRPKAQDALLMHQLFEVGLFCRSDVFHAKFVAHLPRPDFRLASASRFASLCPPSVCAPNPCRFTDRLHRPLESWPLTFKYRGRSRTRPAAFAAQKQCDGATFNADKAVAANPEAGATLAQACRFGFCIANNSAPLCIFAGFFVNALLGRSGQVQRIGF